MRVSNSVNPLNKKIFDINMAFTKDQQDFIRENDGIVSQNKMVKLLGKSKKDISAFILSVRPKKEQKARLFIESEYFDFKDFKNGII